MAQNVKVAIRVRNVPKWFGTDGTKDSIEYRTPIVTVDSPNSATKINQHLIIGSEALQKDKREFSYDYVFSPEDGQEFIYDSLISPLIAKCVQGFNGCVFVYGQTASGKTYTMGGPAVQNPNDRGIILRVAEHLCDYIDKNGRKDLGKAGQDFTVTGSYLEIYNEQLKDLLAKNNEELKIRLDPTSISGKDVYVQGLTQVPLITERDYIKAIETGVAKRKVAETNMNAVSSRSHSIFTLTIIQREYLEGGKEGIKRRSKIHLIDLAGSERADSTGATGQVLKEGAAINQSLSCLGNVINALSVGSTHVPYRDSKLTHLLSDSLGGNSLTILVACLTPIAGAYEESVSTLKFAERVKKIKNKAILNVDANTLRIMALEAENLELKEKLAKCTCGKPATNTSSEQSNALKEKLANKLKAIFKGMEDDHPKVTQPVSGEPIDIISQSQNSLFKGNDANEQLQEKVDSGEEPLKESKSSDANDTEDNSKFGAMVNMWKRKSHAKVEPNDSMNIFERKKSIMGIKPITQPETESTEASGRKTSNIGIKPIAPPGTIKEIINETEQEEFLEKEQERKEQQQEVIELKLKQTKLAQEFRELELMIEQEEANRLEKLSDAADGPDDEYRRLRAEYDEKHKVLLSEKEEIEKELLVVKEKLLDKGKLDINILIVADVSEVAIPVVNEKVRKTKDQENELKVEIQQIHENQQVKVAKENEKQNAQVPHISEIGVAQQSQDDEDEQENDEDMNEYYQQMLRRALDMPSTTQTFFANPKEPNDLSAYKPFMQQALYRGYDEDGFNEFQHLQHNSSDFKYKFWVFLAPILGIAIGFGVGWVVNSKMSDSSNRNVCTLNSTVFTGTTSSSHNNDIVPTNLLAGTPNVRGYVDGKGSVSKFTRLRGIAVNETGHIYVADELTHNIRLISPPSWNVTTFAGSKSLEYGFRNGAGHNSLFSHPRDVLVDNQGTVWIADCGNSLVRKIDSSGKVSSFYNTGGCPVGIAISPRNNHVYVADSTANVIFHLLPSGQISSLIGTGQHGRIDGKGATATFSTVNHLVIDAAGENMYVADCGGCQTTSNNPGTNNLIRKVVLATEHVSTLTPSSSFCGPNYLAISPYTGNLLVTQDCRPFLSTADNPNNSDDQSSVVRYVLVNGGDGVFATNHELMPGFGVTFNAHSALICSDTAIYSVTQ